MTNEQVFNAFKEKGIDVTLYETPFHTVERVVIDTYEHDKQIRADVIEEYTNKLLDLIHRIPSRCIGGANVKEIAEQLKENK